MLTLLIETSTEQGVVFVYRDGQLLYEKKLPRGLNNSSYLMPCLNEMLQTTGLRIDAIELIGLGVGPGSYTGIRIGAMAAKTLSYAKKIPLTGICTLSCFAPKTGGRFAVLIDAKIGGIYFQSGMMGENGAVIESIPEVIKLEELSSKLNGIKKIVTPSSCQLIQKITQVHPGLDLEWEEMAPNGDVMYALSLSNFQKEEFSINGDVELLYMRKTQAEIERESKKFPS